MSIDRNRFGPEQRFELLVTLGGNCYFDDAKTGRIHWAPLSDRASVFKAAGEILRSEGAPLSVVERTISGERF